MMVEVFFLQKLKKDLKQMSLTMLCTMKQMILILKVLQGACELLISKGA